LVEIFAGEYARLATTFPDEKINSDPDIPYHSFKGALFNRFGGFGIEDSISWACVNKQINRKAVAIIVFFIVDIVLRAVLLLDGLEVTPAR
jgi:hypothetical protein